jgi:glycosyltransferase involved in cell wall biosynthesis
VAKYLHRCLDSIVNQTYKNLEIICINDCSTDCSGEILNEYAQKDNRIKIIDREKNGGQSRARNDGLKIANGRWISFVDSDDYINPSTYQDAVNIFADDLDVITWEHTIVKENPTPQRAAKHKKLKFSGNISLNAKVKKELYYVLCDKLYKAEIIRGKNIVFPEDILYEDTPFLIKYLLWCKKAYFINKANYCYVQREDSTMGQLRNKKNKTYNNGLLEALDVYNYCKTLNLLDKQKDIISYIFQLGINMDLNYYPYERQDYLSSARKIITAQNIDINDSFINNLKSGQFAKLIGCPKPPFLKRIFNITNNNGYKIMWLFGFVIKLYRNKKER